MYLIGSFLLGEFEFFWLSPADCLFFHMYVSILKEEGGGSQFPWEFF